MIHELRTYTLVPGTQGEYLKASAEVGLGQDPEWQAFLARATPLLALMQAVVLYPAPHSPMK